MLNAYVSDLFFNLDHSEAVEKDKKGNFTGYSDERLMALAVWFSSAIEEIGGPKVSPDALLADFYRRL